MVLGKRYEEKKTTTKKQKPVEESVITKSSKVITHKPMTYVWSTSCLFDTFTLTTFPSVLRLYHVRKSRQFIFLHI